MLHRIPAYEVVLYKIENDSYAEMINDFNLVIDELELNKCDGIFPVTLSRIYNQGDTYSEIHTELIYILRWGGLVGMLAAPIGLTTELNDKLVGVNIKRHVSYILEKISDDKLVCTDGICTHKGHVFNLFPINDVGHINRMTIWAENYSLDIGIGGDLFLAQGAADYRDHLLDRKYNDMLLMNETGEGLERMAENPFEDMYYSSEPECEPYIDRPSKDTE